MKNDNGNVNGNENGKWQMTFVTYMEMASANDNARMTACTRVGSRRAIGNGNDNYKWQMADMEMTSCKTNNDHNGMNNISVDAFSQALWRMAVERSCEILFSAVFAMPPLSVELRKN